MPIYVRPRNWNTKPTLGSQINWGHPLAQNLIGCFLINHACAKAQVINLVTNRIYDTYSTNAPAVINSFIGPVLDCSAANDTGIFATIDDRFKVTKKVTVAWRGYFAGGTPANNTIIGGITPNNTNSSPFASYYIGVDGGGNVVLRFNNPAFITSTGRAVTNFTDGKEHQFVGTINLNGTSGTNTRLYSDNARLEVSGGTTGTISYTSTAQLAIGCEDPGRGRNSRSVASVLYIWEKEMFGSDVSWLWTEPYSFIQRNNPVKYFLFSAGSIHALNATLESASEIIVNVGNNQAIASKIEAASEIEPRLSASFVLSSNIDSASEIETLLSHEYNLTPIVVESASSINVPILYRAFDLPVTVLDSATEIEALLGRQLALTSRLQTASEIQPSLSRVFTGGIADFNIALETRMPVAALDTGNRPVAFLFSDNDNESELDPDNPNSAPNDNNFFV